MPLTPRELNRATLARQLLVRRRAVAGPQDVADVVRPPGAQERLLPG